MKSYISEVVLQKSDESWCQHHEYIGQGMYKLYTCPALFGQSNDQPRRHLRR